MAETKPKATKKPVRIKVTDKRGNIAQPLEEHLEDWLKAGWKVTNPAEKAD